MAPEMPPTPEMDPSFVRLLVRLVVDLAALAVPLVIPLFLPVTLVWAYLLGVMLAQWLENKLRGAVDVTGVWWLGACLGLSVALGLRAGAMVSGLLVGGASFVALLLAGRAWEKIAGLNSPRPDPGPTLTRIQGVDRPSGRARVETAPMTPEGLRLRVVGCHEPRNSAPLQYDYLFPDGSVVFGAGASMGYSPDGRYFISPMPTTGLWGLLIYDRHARIIYRYDKLETFVEIHAVTQTQVQGWGSRVEKNGRMLAADIDDLIAHSIAEPMVEIADLWLPQSRAEYVMSLQKVELPPAPAGAPALELVASLPENLMALDDPLDPLFAPWFEISVDQQLSGLLVSRYQPTVRWSDDGQTLTCLARPKGSEAPPSGWMWNVTHGWSALAEESNQI